MDRAERFQLLSRLFDDVVDLDVDAREAVIAERCAGDAELERELRELIAADSTGDPSFLSDVVASEAATIPAPDMHGQMLGSWRILEAIGEGGMGTVYLAERADGEYQAQAAIKLVRGGLPGPHLAARFRSERQILAGLSHPGVAQMLDGGTTSDGTPYLVMEYIDGKPITEWCDEQDLDVDARLDVFLKVCDSVAYAHRALVAHRDLKPSNILVSSAGEPKLLDFGIAKLMEEMGEDGEGVTQTYGIMTPAYASPEQVSGERAGVSADIYALGVLLYELLSHRLPIDTKGLTPVQLISRVTQQVPAVLSSVVDDPIRRRRLVGDLDAIVSRSLRKEPEQRYASVETLAEDVRLHRDGRPIRARNDDWRYRTGKLVRRNAGVVSGGALLLILGVTFAINAVLQARAVAVERDRAEAQRVAAERVSTFLEGLFTEVDPNQASAADVTVRQLLDRGADQVLAGLEAEPEIQARLATVMGRVYRALAEYDAAQPLLDSALAVRRRLPAGDASDLAVALLERGALAYDMGEYEEAVDFQTAALADFRDAASGRDDPFVASALDWLSVSQQELGLLEEAERNSRESLAMLRRLNPEPNEDVASGLVSLTDILRGNAKLDEALAVGQEGLAMARQLYGNDHLEVAAGLNQMASTLNQLGRAEEAIPLVEEGLAIRMAAFEGKPHVETGASLGNLANMLVSVGRVDEAIERRQQSIDMLRAVVGEDHPYIAASLNSLGGTLAAAGRTEEAVTLYRESIEAHRRAFPPGHPNIGYPLTGLGRVYLDERRPADAETLLREAYDARAGGLPARHWHIAASGLDLGRALDALGRLDEAERYLVEAYEILGETFGPDDSRTGQAREALRDHLARRGLTERAAAVGASTGG